MTSADPTRRPTGRSPLGRSRRLSIAFRIDPDLLATLRTQAEARGLGYTTYMHQILERVAKATQKRSA